MNTKIAAALLAAQKEMGNAVKGASNPFFKSRFADLNSVREAVIPVLNKYGMSVLQLMKPLDGRQYIETLVLHESGESISSFTEIVCAKQNDPQAYGSAVSYARRYGLQSLPCIGAEDDDGEAGMGRTNSKVLTGNKQVVPNVPSQSRTAVVANSIATTTIDANYPTTNTAPPSFNLKKKSEADRI